MERFVRRQNIEHYREMLKTITDPAKRCVIEKLLLDELAEQEKGIMQPARERGALSKHRLNNSIFMALNFPRRSTDNEWVRKLGKVKYLVRPIGYPGVKRARFQAQSLAKAVDHIVNTARRP